MSLSATDMDIDILEKFNCNVINPGSVTVTANIFYDVVRKLMDGSEIQIEFNGGTASLISNKSKFQLPVLPVEDYPNLNQDDLPINFKVSVEELCKLIDKTKFDAPESMIQNYLDHIIENNKAQQPGMTEEQEKEMRDSGLEGAIFNVKWYLVKEQIVNTEKISVSKEDMDNRTKE